MGLAENVSALATRVATEIKAVRTEIAAKASTTYVDNAIAASDLADAADNRGDFNPSDHSLDVWTCDPLFANGTYSPTANGTLVISAIKVNAPIVAGSVAYAIATAGATFTASRNYIGLYDEAGTLLRSTADQTTWTTVGNKNTAFTAGNISLAVGTYYVGLITTATTRPAFTAINTNNNVVAFGRTSNSVLRTYTVAGTYTALPATRPVGTFIPTSLIWFGLA